MANTIKPCNTCLERERACLAYSWLMLQVKPFEALNVQLNYPFCELVRALTVEQSTDLDLVVECSCYKKAD